MNYQCKAWDCSHSFDIETKEDKIALFANCPRCGCVAELREGALTPREMMKRLGYDCIEQRYHGAFDSFSSCPFAYDCYLVDQYITDCERRKDVSHRCLIHLDSKLSVLENKLDRILAHFRIS
nr:MAG TPA: hypothetical protein [Caudoviricetes sp.]